MGLFERLGQVLRSQMTAWVSQSEDPEKLLIQTVAAMEQDLLQLRQAVAEAIALQKRTERQQAQAQLNADEWYRRAQMAMDQDQEALARDALLKRQALLETVRTYGTQVTAQDHLSEQLKQNLRALEVKLGEIRAKRDVYLVRARSAEASQRMTEMMSRYNPNGTEAVFERMEEKITQLEAQAELGQELGRDRVDEAFRGLEAGEDVEAQLALLRRQRGLG
jgi:phage shock protein A